MLFLFTVSTTISLTDFQKRCKVLFVASCATGWMLQRANNCDSPGRWTRWKTVLPAGHNATGVSPTLKPQIFLNIRFCHQYRRTDKVQKPRNLKCPHNFIYLKVKCSRYRPGVAQKVGRGIALLFHDSGTRRGWVVSSTPRPHFTSGKDAVPILQETGWAPGPVWTGWKSRTHWNSILDHPARSQ